MCAVQGTLVWEEVYLKRRGKSPNTVRLETDVADLLRRLRIPNKRNGDEFFIHCVNPEHPDTDPSMQIHSGGSKNGLVYCFPCSWSGDVFTLVQLVKGVDFPAALKYVSVSRIRVEEILDEEEDDDGELLRPYYPREIDRPNVKEVKAGSDCARYLATRGIGRKEIEKYGIMDWKEHWRVWVPITRQKRLVSWAARAYTRQRIKAMTPKGEWLGSRWGIFGLDQADRSEQEASVTEGFSSAIRVGQANFLNPLALCGSVVKEEQLDDLDWVKRFIVWQEGDAAGKAFTKQFKQWYRGREIEVVKLPRKKDPGNFMPSELVKLYFRSRR